MKSASSPNARITKLPRKDRLFEDFFRNMVETTQRMEGLFGLEGVQEQIFGRQVYLSARDIQDAKERLRDNRSWRLLSELYEFAVNGVSIVRTPESESDAESSLVIDAGEVVAMLRGEEQQLDEEWDAIVLMGDARVGLSEGLPVDIERLALLANVDVRTVRNAISSGALPVEDGRVPSSDARAWLIGRKGFKPTVYAREFSDQLGLVSTEEEFGVLLRQSRSAHEAQDEARPASEPAHPGLTQDVLREVESGVFRLPLSMVNPLADFYGLPREDFLRCVMRVHFPEQLAILDGQPASKERE